VFAVGVSSVLKDFLHSTDFCGPVCSMVSGFFGLRLRVLYGVFFPAFPKGGGWCKLSGES